MKTSYFLLSIRYAVSIFLFIFSPISFGTIIDLRNSSDFDGEYEIGFCARPSPDAIKNLPGHAFVSFSHIKKDGKRDFLSIGHTVQEGAKKEAAWSYFGDSVSGYLKEENYTSVMQLCLVVKVNKDKYEKAFNLTKNPLENMGIIPSKDNRVLEAYKLGSNDCMSFMMSVAEIFSLYLEIPQRNNNEFPMDYMSRFIESNRKPKNPGLSMPEGLKIY